MPANKRPVTESYQEERKLHKNIFNRRAAENAVLYYLLRKIYSSRMIFRVEIEYIVIILFGFSVQIAFRFESKIAPKQGA
jgi:hypothetical protein